MIKKIVFALLVFVSSTQIAQADFNDGVVAYLTGDYDTAFNTMMSLADTTDDAMAQYWLGTMYLKGQGVDQDYEKASKWLRRASEQSIPNAQYKLARLYAEGNGVPQDSEFAYIWYSVGAAHEHTKSVNAISDARAQLSEDELNAAEKMIPEYVEKYGPKPEEDKNVGGKTEK